MDAYYNKLNQNNIHCADLFEQILHFVDPRT